MVVAREVFGSLPLREELRRWDNRIDAGVQTRMRLEMRTLVERASRWLVLNRRAPIDSQATVDHFAGPVQETLAELPDLMVGAELAAYHERRDALVEQGVPRELASRVAVLPPAYAVLGVVDSATRLGLEMRAVTQNRRMAACVGVRTARVDSYAFAFGAGIAGLGGCALSQIGNVGPDLGQAYIIDSFMVVVLGGVGQLAGTIVGAFGLGIINKFIEPFYGAVLAKIFVLVLIVLFIQKRPQGLFALKGRSAEA